MYVYTPLETDFAEWTDNSLNFVMWSMLVICVKTKLSCRALRGSTTHESRLLRVFDAPAAARVQVFFTDKDTDHWDKSSFLLLLHYPLTYSSTSPH